MQKAVGLAVLALLAVAVPARAATLSFMPPAEYDGATETAGASWVLLVFADNASASFSMRAPQGGTMGNDTLTHVVRVEDPTHVYHLADHWDHEKTPVVGPLGIQLGFASPQGGSLYIEASSIHISAEGSKGTLAVKPAGSTLDPFERHDDQYYERERAHDPPGPAVAITAGRLQPEQAMGLRIEAEGNVYAEWYNAGVECDRQDGCPSGGGASVTSAPAPSGYRITSERHSYVSMQAIGTLDGSGSLDYAIFGGQHVSFGLNGHTRLPRSSETGACTGCPEPHDQTVALAGNLTLADLHTDGFGLVAEPRGDLRAARIDETSVDPRAIVGGAVAAVVVVAAGGWVVANYLASSLFTRIQQPAALNQPRRKAIYEAVVQEPGISLSELGRRTGISRGALGHHVRLLQDFGLLQERHFGQSVRLFVQGIPAASQMAFAALQHPTARDIWSTIARHPGIIQGQLLAAYPRIPRSSVQFHLGQLVKNGIVVRQRLGRRMAYSTASGLLSQSVVSAICAAQTARVP